MSIPHGSNQIIPRQSILIYKSSQRILPVCPAEGGFNKNLYISSSEQDLRAIWHFFYCIDLKKADNVDIRQSAGFLAQESL